MSTARLAASRLFLALLATTPLACGASPGANGSGARGRAEDVWTRRVPPGPGARLELVNVNGAISAEAADGETLELTAKRTVRARNDEAARELLAKLEMRESARDGVVRIEVVHPSPLRSANIEVRWSVRVPAGVAVDLRNESGRIALSGLTGEVRARSVNGAILGEALATQIVSATTTNGRVALALAQPLTGAGRIAAEAVNGSVEVALPADSKASLRASVTNGAVHAAGLDVTHSRARSRTRLEGTLGGGGTPVTLETTNGSARIRNATAPATSPKGDEPAPTAAPPVDPARIANGAVDV
ncbi:MAG TPA: DUF4097 family beta strand repeat-containing protein [Myxococcota bacterium]|nr:DUF4097 family beta strand repeat-containing protein [Myxococcota bacterium]